MLYTIPFSVTPPAAAADITAFTIVANGETIIVKSILLTDELAASGDRAARFRMKRADSITSAGTGTTITPLPARVGYAAFVGTVKNNYSIEPTLDAGTLADAHPSIPFAAGGSLPVNLNDGEGVRLVGTKAVQCLISCAAGTRANPITGVAVLEIP